MTRKRFIKLLMARGMSRNEATGMANCCSARISHADAYRGFLFDRLSYTLADVSSAFSRTAALTQKAATSLANMTRAIKQFLEKADAE